MNRGGILVAAHAPAGYGFEVVGRTKRGKVVRGKLVPNGDAPAIRAAFELKAAGGSWAEVAGLLAEAGVPTIRGQAVWSKMAARSVIENVAYMGTVRNGGRERLKAHEAIVPGWRGGRRNRAGGLPTRAARDTCWVRD